MSQKTPPNTAPEEASLYTLPPAVQQQIGELIAAHELAAERLTHREEALEEQIHVSLQVVQEQLDKVNALISEIQKIITETGAARLRLSAQEALKLGEMQLASLRKLSEDTRLALQESSARFDHTSASMVKNLNDALNHFKSEDFQAFIEQSCQQVNTTATSVLDKINSIFRGFHWKNLIFGLGIAVITAVGMGLYLNNEWPWETHQKVVKQRVAGQALMRAWPHLSLADQHYLEKYLRLSETGN